jgi:argininosuccinate synthase
MSQIKKVVLAYSGGLDTSIILRWLQEHLRLRSRDLHRRHRSG